MCGDRLITRDRMKTSRLDYLSPEILSMIAGYLPPSDILSLSVASKSGTILLPDFDKIVINKSKMIRQENYKVILLDTDVSEEVNEVLVTYERVDEVPVCTNFQPVFFKRNLFVTEDATTFDLLPAKKLGNGKTSTLRGSIARQGDRLTVEIYEDFCCRVKKANVFVFYKRKRATSATFRRVSALNIIPVGIKRNR